MRNKSPRRTVKKVRIEPGLKAHPPAHGLVTGVFTRCQLNGPHPWERPSQPKRKAAEGTKGRRLPTSRDSARRGRMYTAPTARDKQRGSLVQECDSARTNPARQHGARDGRGKRSRRRQASGPGDYGSRPARVGARPRPRAAAYSCMRRPRIMHGGWASGSWSVSRSRAARCAQFESPTQTAARCHPFPTRFLFPRRGTASCPARRNNCGWGQVETARARYSSGPHRASLLNEITNRRWLDRSRAPYTRRPKRDRGLGESATRSWTEPRTTGRTRSNTPRFPY